MKDNYFFALQYSSPLFPTGTKQLDYELQIHFYRVIVNEGAARENGICDRTLVNV